MGQPFNACVHSVVSVLDVPSLTFEVLCFAGITNYIDLGLQVVTDMVDGPAGGNGTNGPGRPGGAPGSAALGAAWQVQRTLGRIRGKEPGLGLSGAGAGLRVLQPHSSTVAGCKYAS